MKRERGLCSRVQGVCPPPPPQCGARPRGRPGGGGGHTLRHTEGEGEGVLTDTAAREQARGVQTENTSAFVLMKEVRWMKRDDAHSSPLSPHTHTGCRGGEGGRSTGSACTGGGGEGGRTQQNFKQFHGKYDGEKTYGVVECPKLFLFSFSQLLLLFRAVGRHSLIAHSHNYSLIHISLQFIIPHSLILIFSHSHILTFSYSHILISSSPPHAHRTAALPPRRDTRGRDDGGRREGIYICG